MKGLILKDLLNLKKDGRIYFIMIIVYGIFSIITKNVDMIGIIGIVLGMNIPITTIAYDERANFNRYALGMPISKTEIVQSKYIFSVIMSVLAGIMVLIVYSIDGRVMEGINIGISILGASLIINAIILPCIFKFGVEKARIMIVVIVLIPVLLFTGLDKIGVLQLSNEILSFLNKYLSIILVLISTILLCISMITSVKIYKSKEF